MWKNYNNNHNKSESILEKEMHRYLWNLNYERISQTQPVFINEMKRTCRLVDFAVPADHRVRIKESEKINRFQDLTREQKKNMEYVGDSDNKCSW